MFNTRMVHPSMGMTAKKVVKPAATTGLPTFPTACLARSSLSLCPLVVNASARCNEKSQLKPTKIVMLTASTIPSDHPAKENTPSTLTTMATNDTVANAATTAFPVNASTDATANAVLI